MVVELSWFQVEDVENPHAALATYNVANARSAQRLGAGQLQCPQPEIRTGEGSGPLRSVDLSASWRA